MRLPKLDPRGFMLNLLLVLLFNSFIAGTLWLFMTPPFGEQMIWSQCIGLSIFFCINLICRTWPGGQTSLKPTWPLIISASALGAFVGENLAAWILYGNPLVLWTNHTRVMLISSGLALGFGTLGTLVFSARAKVLDARLEVAEANAARAAGERRLAQTQLRLIQAQIEPHFLFNTLSNVTALIDSEPEKARRMLTLFTRYLRVSLDRTRTSNTTLADEVALISAYLEIQAMRMGSRLKYRLEVPDVLRGLPLAPLLLQPLVENAVIHGIEPANEGGEILVQAEEREGTLAVTVTDSGVGMGGGKSGSGIGLENVRERLRALYGLEADLILAPNAPHGFVARLRIPLATLAA